MVAKSIVPSSVVVVEVPTPLRTPAPPSTVVPVATTTTSSAPPKSPSPPPPPPRQASPPPRAALSPQSDATTPPGLPPPEARVVNVSVVEEDSTKPVESPPASKATAGEDEVDMVEVGAADAETDEGQKEVEEDEKVDLEPHSLGAEEEEVKASSQLSPTPYSSPLPPPAAPPSPLPSEVAPTVEETVAPVMKKAPSASEFIRLPSPEVSPTSSNRRRSIVMDMLEGEVGEAGSESLVGNELEVKAEERSGEVREVKEEAELHPIVVDGETTVEEDPSAPSMAMDVDGDERQPQGEQDEDEDEEHVPSPRPDFTTILGGLIELNAQDRGEVNAVIVENWSKPTAFPVPSYVVNETRAMIRDLTNMSREQDAIDSKRRLGAFLADEFEERDERRGHKMVELREEYRSWNEDWKAHCRRLDRVKDRIHRRHNPAQPTSTLPPTPSIDSSGLPFYPEVTTPGPSAPLGVGTGRANRRNANAAFGYGDAVRSEAEFLEILASLETADMRDPNVRATRTAAVVPDMIIDASEGREVRPFDDEYHRVVNDAEEFYGIHEPLDIWTEEEVQIFCKRYSQHPKQFSRIAADLPEKTTSQCVLFYYRMKNTIDFRSLSDRRGRDGRRRKNRRRADVGGARKSLLSNLKRVRPDDRDDDEDSPPPSPRGGGRKVLPDTPSVFQAPEPSSRPPPPPPLSISTATTDIDDFPSATFDRPTPSRTSSAATAAALAKKARTPKFRDAKSLPASEGTMEAAEVLGALGGVDPNDGDEADEDVAGKSRKRKVRVEFDSAGVGVGAGTGGDDAVKSATAASASSRRKSASSSYWSIAERNEFINLLGQYGKNWTRLAEGLENKTAVQCRNWFQNHAKKLNLAEIAKNADNGFDEDGEDEGGSGLVTPSGDASVGTPLSESHGATANGPAMPRAGFFVPDKRSPRPPALELAKLPKTGMQIRNLLNDDTPDEEVPPPLGEDWFGAANGGENGSVTTEDESDAPKPHSHQRGEGREREYQHAREAPRTDYHTQTGPTYPPYSDRRDSYDSYRGPPPPVHYASSYAPPGGRFEASRAHTVLGSPWAQSPVSGYPSSYGNSPINLPSANQDYYRDHHSSSQPPPRSDYFGVQQPRPLSSSSYPDRQTSHSHANFPPLPPPPVNGKYPDDYDPRPRPEWSSQQDLRR